MKSDDHLLTTYSLMMSTNYVFLLISCSNVHNTHSWIILSSTIKLQTIPDHVFRDLIFAKESRTTPREDLAWHWRTKRFIPARLRAAIRMPDISWKYQDKKVRTDISSAAKSLMHAKQMHLSSHSLQPFDITDRSDSFFLHSIIIIFLLAKVQLDRP